MTQPALAIAENTVLRPAGPPDIACIQALAHDIWPVCFADILTSEQITNILGHIYHAESLKTQMQDGQRFWLAFEDARPVGYASAYKEDDTIWLKKLYLHANAQGKGLGYRLMECALSPHLPATEVRLLTNCRNLAAQRFYRRAGFTQAGEVPVMMGDHAFTDYLFVKSYPTQ